MKFHPLISVIVPVYNGADFVADAIESILAQTYKNFEILVVDDGSTDGGATKKAIEPYLDQVKYFWQENGGVAAALNTGIDKMKGEYFAWLSHDDIFVPNKLKSQVKILKNLPDRKILLYSDYSIINSEKKQMYDVKLDVNMLNNSSNHMPVLRGCLNGCTMLVHHKIFEDCGLFDLNLRYTQDYEMWDRVCWKYPMIHQAKITVRQRVHDNQDSHKPEALQECNELWINTIKNRDTATRTEISGSSLQFLKGMRSFLSHTPYNDAKEFVENEINIEQQRLSSSEDELAPSATKTPGLTLILNNETTVKEATKSLSSLVKLKPGDFEIIFITDGSKTDERIRKKLNKMFKDVCVIEISGGDVSLGREKAILEAKFQYVMFLTTQIAIVKNNLTHQILDMKKTSSSASYAPYISVCNEISQKSLLVPCHWLGLMTIENIITKCAVNFSTMIFDKNLFTDKLAPPNNTLHSEIEFLVNVARTFEITSFSDLSIISFTNFDFAPLNLTLSLDAVSHLIENFGNYSEFEESEQIQTDLKKIHEELYKIRIEIESSDKNINVNHQIESFYQAGSISTHTLLGSFGLLDIEFPSGVK